MIVSDEPWLHLLSVSWPRPADVDEGRWVGTPAWDAPVMPSVPSWRFHVLDGVECEALNWSDFFRSDLRRTGSPTAAQMRNFYVVFRLRVQATGHLVFCDTDGCIMRRKGEIIHEDRERHPLRRHEVPVRMGDYLEVAQWQSGGLWIWGARCEGAPVRQVDLLENVALYRCRVEDELTGPDGPMLKMFTNAVDPVRCALSIYSLVLNGYRPAGIQVFGDHQWTAQSAHVMRTLLPFADIISLDRLARTLDSLNPGLMPLARRNWGAMKICIGLFYPPREYCFLDDDIFVLDRMDDALALHDAHDLVYSPDSVTTFRYATIRHPARQDVVEPPVLRNMSTGLYLIKNTGNLEAQSRRLLDTSTDGHPIWSWEQGFFSWEFGNRSTVALSDQRYFAARLDGLPGGVYGYDWHGNPCDFTCVHFGGMIPKPGDHEAGILFEEILGRHGTALLRRARGDVAGVSVPAVNVSTA